MNSAKSVLFLCLRKESTSRTLNFTSLQSCHSSFAVNKKESRSLAGNSFNSPHRLRRPETDLRAQEQLSELQLQ